MKIIQIGQILALIGTVVAPLSAIGSLIVLLFGGHWQQALSEVGAILALGLVVLPLLFGVSSIAMRRAMRQALTDGSRQRLAKLAALNAMWQSIVLMALAYCGHEVLRSTGTVTFNLIVIICAILGSPLFVLASRPAKSERAQERDFIDAGIFATGVALSLLPLLFDRSAAPSIVPIIIFALLRVWFAAAYTNYLTAFYDDYERHLLPGVQRRSNVV